MQQIFTCVEPIGQSAGGALCASLPYAAIRQDDLRQCRKAAACDIKAANSHGSLSMSQFRFALILLALLIAASLTLQAQQPGSAAYHSRVLPAHGLGDTKQRPQSWGAFSMADNAWAGWATNARTENEARSESLANCTERGGVGCKVLFVFANSCGAVAVSEVDSAWASGEALEVVRSKALASCGANCTIFREGCSYPQ